MSESIKKILLVRSDSIPADKMLVTMTAADLRAVIREEIARSAKPEKDDELIDARRAAALLGVSVEWIFHNRKKLPFARKIGPKSLRFSLGGLREWIEAKKP